MAFDKMTQSIIEKTGFVQLNLGEMVNAGLDKMQRPALQDISKAELTAMRWAADGVVCVGDDYVGDMDMYVEFAFYAGSVVQSEEDGAEDAIMVEVRSETEGRIGWGRAHDMGLMTLGAERVAAALGPDYIIRAGTESTLDHEIWDECGDEVHRAFFVILRDPEMAGDFSEDYFDMQRCVDAVWGAVKAVRDECADAADAAYADAMESAYQSSIAARASESDDSDVDDADEADDAQDSDEAWSESEYDDIVANGIGRIGVRAVRRRGHEIHAHDARALFWNAPLSVAHLGSDAGDEAWEDYAYAAFGADANCERVVGDEPREIVSGYAGSNERRERNRRQAIRRRDARRRARQAYFAALDKVEPAFSPRYRKPEYAPDSVAARIVDSNRASDEIVYDKAA